MLQIWQPFSYVFLYDCSLHIRMYCEALNRNTSYQFLAFLDIHFITDRERSTREGYVLTRVCPSIRLSVHT